MQRAVLVDFDHTKKGDVAQDEAGLLRDNTVATTEAEEEGREVTGEAFYVGTVQGCGDRGEP